MRPWESDHHGERAFFPVVLDEPDGLPAYKAINRIFPLQQIDDGAAVFPVPLMLVAVVLAQSFLVQVVVVVVADMQPSLVLGYDPVLESVSGVPWVEVHLADCRRVVSRVREDLRPRTDANVVVVASYGVEVIGHAVPYGVHSCEQGRTGRHADRGRRIGVFVSGAVLSQRVDVGRVDEGLRRSSQGSRTASGRGTGIRRSVSRKCQSKSRLSIKGCPSSRPGGLPKAILWQSYYGSPTPRLSHVRQTRPARLEPIEGLLTDKEQFEFGRYTVPNTRLLADRNMVQSGQSLALEEAGLLS